MKQRPDFSDGRFLEAKKRKSDIDLEAKKLRSDEAKARFFCLKILRSEEAMKQSSNFCYSLTKKRKSKEVDWYFLTANQYKPRSEEAKKR